FNQASLRSCIERAFGILKERWKILAKLSKYSLQDQKRLICAAFALHNYIRRIKVPDTSFMIIDKDPDFIPPEVLTNVDYNPMQEVHCMNTNHMTKV
ncbi:hypothetical protein PHJA_002655700, partial [Phtheirospermum japonicum]